MHTPSGVKKRPIKRPKTSKYETKSTAMNRVPYLIGHQKQMPNICRSPTSCTAVSHILLFYNLPITLGLLDGNCKQIRNFI